jgi:hypothetical protein
MSNYVMLNSNAVDPVVVVKRFSPSKMLNIETIFRRLGWGLALLISGAAAAAQNAGTKSPAAARAGFRFEAIGTKSLGLWEGDRPVFAYHFGAMTSSNAPTLAAGPIIFILFTGWTARC